MRSLWPWGKVVSTDSLVQEEEGTGEPKKRAGVSFIAYTVIAYRDTILVEVSTPLKENLPDYAPDIEKCPRYARKLLERLQKAPSNDETEGLIASGKGSHKKTFVTDTYQPPILFDSSSQFLLSEFYILYISYYVMLADQTILFPLHRFTFNYVKKKDMLFMCIAEKDHPQQACFQYLRELRLAWKEAYPAMDYSVLYSSQTQATFAPTVTQKMVQPRRGFLLILVN
jgi:hypothetical protein